MKTPEIRRRIAEELRQADIKDAGLILVHDTAPKEAPVEGPVAIVFAGILTKSNLGGEQVWEDEFRVQLMMPQPGPGGINVLEELVAPIADHFDPKQPAYTLRSASAPGHVNRCDPIRFEASQEIKYAGVVFAAIVVTFAVKHHRIAGDT